MRAGQLENSVDVICPFYKWHERQRVNCEGMQHGSNLGQQFRSDVQREQFMLDKCAGRYKTCAIYEIIIKKKYPEAME